MTQRTALVLIGPQGSGKGTQAALLASEEGFSVIEAGGLLRTEARKDTHLGQKLAAIVGHGDLVPDDITMQLVRQKLDGLPKDAKVIFDGFPRTVEQAKLLDQAITITFAVHIDVPHDVSVKRISGRLTCPHGHNYNAFYVPPRTPGICNVDKLPLSARADDTVEGVEHRLGLYTEVTVHVIDYYKTQDKLIAVNGDASVFAVAREIKNKVLTRL